MEESFVRQAMQPVSSNRICETRVAVILEHHVGDMDASQGGGNPPAQLNIGR